MAKFDLMIVAKLHCSGSTNLSELISIPPEIIRKQLIPLNSLNVWETKSVDDLLLYLKK